MTKMKPSAEEREELKWAGDEAAIRLEHEAERQAQNGRIGSCTVVNPYTYARVGILLRRLDEARAEAASTTAHIVELQK